MPNLNAGPASFLPITPKYGFELPQKKDQSLVSGYQLTLPDRELGEVIVK